MSRKALLEISSREVHMREERLKEAPPLLRASRLLATC